MTRSRQNRTEGDTPRGKAILSCRIRVSIPESHWAAGFTRDNPSVRVDILDRLELGGGLTLLEVRIVSNMEQDWSKEISALPGVKEVEVIEQLGGSETCRVVFRAETFIPLLKKLKLLRHFPFPIQDGMATWTIVGPEPKVKELIRKMEGAPSKGEVVAVRHGPLPGGLALLTPRQQEVLKVAISEGYFDVPRRISLTELAGKLDVALSTLSVTLAVIEKKILEPHA